MCFTQFSFLFLLLLNFVIKLCKQDFVSLVFGFYKIFDFLVILFEFFDYFFSNFLSFLYKRRGESFKLVLRNQSAHHIILSGFLTSIDIFFERKCIFNFFLSFGQKLVIHSLIVLLDIEKDIGRYFLRRDKYSSEII